MAIQKATKYMKEALANNGLKDDDANTCYMDSWGDFACLHFRASHRVNHCEICALFHGDKIISLVQSGLSFHKKVDVRETSWKMTIKFGDAIELLGLGEEIILDKSAKPFFETMVVNLTKEGFGNNIEVIE